MFPFSGPRLSTRTSTCRGSRCYSVLTLTSMQIPVIPTTSRHMLPSLFFQTFHFTSSRLYHQSHLFFDGNHYSPKCVFPMFIASACGHLKMCLLFVLTLVYNHLFFFSCGPLSSSDKRSPFFLFQVRSWSPPPLYFECQLLPQLVHFLLPCVSPSHVLLSSSLCCSILGLIVVRFCNHPNVHATSFPTLCFARVRPFLSPAPWFGF